MAPTHRATSHTLFSGSRRAAGRSVRYSAYVLCLGALVGSSCMRSTVAPPAVSRQRESGGSPPITCLCLTTHAADFDKHADGGLLLREIFRQALLIAARDELGLQTRDASIGELGHAPVDAERRLADGCRVLDLRVLVQPSQAVRLELQDSPSGRSKDTRLVSATAAVK